MRRSFHAMRKRWKNRDDRAKLYIFRAFSWMQGTKTTISRPVVVLGRGHRCNINPENAPMARNDVLGAFDVGRVWHIGIGLYWYTVAAFRKDRPKSEYLEDDAPSQLRIHELRIRFK